MFSAWLSLTGKGELLARSIEDKDIDGYRPKSDRERRAPRVRTATEEDLARVREIVNHYIEHSVFNFRTEPQSIHELRACGRSGTNGFPWLVATVDDRVIGVAYAGPWNDRAAYRWTVEIHRLRRGVCASSGGWRRALRRVARSPAPQGFHSAVAVIALPNDPSVRLHERHGFARVGHLREAGYKHDAWHDVGFWQCLLAGG